MCGDEMDWQAMLRKINKAAFGTVPSDVWHPVDPLTYRAMQWTLPTLRRKANQNSEPSRFETADGYAGEGLCLAVGCTG